MFPSDWAHQTGQRKKRKSAEQEAQQQAPPRAAEVDPEQEPAPHAASEDLELPSLILRSLNTSSRAPATPDELNLDVILSRVPYKEILENLYGREEYSVPAVPIVARVYEESFMREPTKGERACAAGELCECNFIDPCMPFTAAEFILPGEDYPQSPQFCVLCSRKVTQKLFYDVLFTGQAKYLFVLFVCLLKKNLQARKSRASSSATGTSAACKVSQCSRGLPPACSAPAPRRRAASS